MIKNLIFDFGKVLVDYNFSLVINEFFANDRDREEFTNIVITDEFMRKCDTEDIPFIELIESMKSQYPSLSVPFQLFYDRFNDVVTGEVPGMYQLLQEMKGRGYKLYGLTNWCSKVHDVMRKYDIFKLLDGAIISSEEHMVKPDANIYLRLCDKFSLKPEECLFTDDKPINIDGARNVGMKAVVFTDARQYRQDMERILKM